MQLALEDFGRAERLRVRLRAIEAGVWRLPVWMSRRRAGCIERVVGKLRILKERVLGYGWK